MSKTFSSSKGIAIDLKPVSQFKLDTLKSSKVDAPIPTYTANLAGGGKQEYPLDEEIARNKNRLDEWTNYVNAQKALDAEHAKKFLELVIWEGVDVVVPDMESDWQKSQEYFGMKVPENPIERKLYYVYNELLATPDDIGNLIADIFAVSQIDEQAVAKLRSSFRLGVQRKTDSRLPKSKKQLANSKSDIQST